MIEKEIWDKLKSGRIEALEEIYNIYFDSLYSYALKLTLDPSKSQDAIHDLFVDLWKYSTKLSDTTSIRFYLLRALRRKIHSNQTTSDRIDLDDYRKENPTEQSSHESGIIKEESKRQQSLYLQQSMDKLSERQKEAVHLKFFGELTYAEIADIMEVNEQSARNLVNRGLDYLRKLMISVIMMVTLIIL
ncbi:MAG: sigma-70 family RNA polymerase sigma factor [Cyclobacteriaceae bacterium]|nr:sigma-70 family RNA polymerase sigma factor [Cyclobacteriaceae bacterium HetDA_MAG_MS6]